MRRGLMVLVSLLLAIGIATPVLGQLPAGWTSRDIGGPAAAGNAQYDETTQTWTVQGDGTGIRGNADQFQFVHKTLSGDGELVARVVSLDPPMADWSMAGVMIRVMLAPESPYVFMGVSANTDTRDHGITLWGRTLPGAAADHESTGAITAPYWVKIERTGDTFTGYSSPNGKEWIEQYSEEAPGVPKNTYIGYAVTSEVRGKLVTAVFDQGPVKAFDPEPADGAKDVATPLVRWTPGVTATMHDVYFGTSPTLGAAEHRVQLPLTSTVYFHTSDFAPATTYYWRIDEVGLDGTTIYPGDVWSFTSAPATAYAPEPWDGLDGVDVKADLAWTPGAGAVSHDVYFGTDKAAVAAGDASTFKGNQAVMTYDPGTLAENATYYWRIDEHDEDGVVHAGAVWSFTTVGPGVGVQARYFEGIDLSGAPVLTRIEDSIDHGWGSDEIVPGLSDSVSAQWTANLKAPFTETYQLITTSDDGVRLWLDGRLMIDNWTNHGSTDDVATVDLIAGQVYLLQMDWYESGGSAVARLSWQSPSIDRQIIPAGPLLLPRRTTRPYPANAGVNTPQTLLLSWIAGEQATRHDVYFGEDADAVTEADTSTAGIYQGRQTADVTTFDPGPLEWNKTYSWRVDEVNEADAGSPWTGAIWSFTTADFLVIDDFESYTDDIVAEQTIFQTWLDGLTNNTGSYVGYPEAPFAEQKIVHSGCQSMPMDYSNTDSPWYSEAERTWKSPQDWTVNGVDTLILYVRGMAGNAPAQLYVAIRDKANRARVIKHPDAAPVTSVLWAEWSIPLADVIAAGVDVTAVKTLYIGVGNREQPTPGGSGRIYIDDIRVIEATPAGM